MIEYINILIIIIKIIYKISNEKKNTVNNIYILLNTNIPIKILYIKNNI